MFYILALDYGLFLCPGHHGRHCDSHKIESLSCWTPLIGSVWGTPLHTCSHSYRNPGREAFRQTVNFTHLLWPRKQMAQKLIRISEERSQCQRPGHSMGEQHQEFLREDTRIASSPPDDCHNGEWLESLRWWKGGQIVTQRIWLQSYPVHHSLWWSLPPGCSQAPRRVKGAIYGAAESVDAGLSVLLDTAFRGRDGPEVGAADGGFFRKFLFERGPDAPLKVRGAEERPFHTHKARTQESRQGP